MDEAPKKVVRLPISMLSPSEDSSDCEWEEELTPNSCEDKRDVGSSKIVCPANSSSPMVAADSFEGDSDEDKEDVGSSKKRRKIVSPASSDGFRLSPLVAADSFEGYDDDEEDKKDVGSSKKRKKIVCPANPEEYPQLASFLRQNHMEEELQRNWTVIGNENASKLQQQWIQIMDNQMDIAAQRMDLIQDIFDIINPDANLILPDHH